MGKVTSQKPSIPYRKLYTKLANVIRQETRLGNPAKDDLLEACDAVLTEAYEAQGCTVTVRDKVVITTNTGAADSPNIPKTKVKKGHRWVAGRLVKA